MLEFTERSWYIANSMGTLVLLARHLKSRRKPKKIVSFFHDSFNRQVSLDQEMKAENKKPLPVLIDMQDWNRLSMMGVPL